MEDYLDKLIKDTLNNVTRSIDVQVPDKLKERVVQEIAQKSAKDNMEKKRQISPK